MSQHQQHELRRSRSWYLLHGNDSVTRAAPDPCLPAPSGYHLPRGHAPREAKPRHHDPHLWTSTVRSSGLSAASLLEGGIPGEPRVYQPPKDSQGHPLFLLFLSHGQKSICLLSCFVPLVLSASSPSSPAVSLHHSGLSRATHFV